MKYDVIFLSELKGQYTFSIPGFHCIRSELIQGEENRGGVAVLFKNTVWLSVYDVTRIKDQIWFRLKDLEGILFGALYIAPRDSPFFDMNSFTFIHEQAKCNNEQIILLGDLNARMGNMDALSEPNESIIYSQNADPVTNTNGRELLNLCLSCKLKPLNHMQYSGTCFNGGLTFKQKDRWISQLDWAVVSKDAINYVVSFDILQSYSLPTNHAPIALQIKPSHVTAKSLLERASQLGMSIQRTKSQVKMPIKMHNIDVQAFSQKVPNPDDLWRLPREPDILSDAVADLLYNTAKLCKKRHIVATHQSHTDATSRWTRILNSKDSRQLWQSINWKGDFDTPPDLTMQPSDDEFCHYYETLLATTSYDSLSYTPDTPRYIPVLDSPISPEEVDNSIKRLKANKACGIDGVAPGLLKLLNEEWIIFITYIFNIVFISNYPLMWTLAKVFNIFKKGNCLDPTNYRGISILTALAKLFDSILCERFKLWYKPQYEQAGGQAGRGCAEQIMTVRLLIDIARKKGRTLYITFIDYQKAYDRVNRLKLLQFLDRKGCGSVFLEALRKTYAMTTGTIGDCTFNAKAGVRQGSSTSCPLFTFFIDPTLDALRVNGDDGWLGNLHGLLLMDDTIIFATTRDGMKHKLQALKMCVDDIGMVINSSKSQFLCVNGDDVNPFDLGGVEICLTNSYTYLGVPISISSVTDQVKAHLSMKSGHVFKFYSFLRKNDDAPYVVKKRVWESALCSALFYGCESWFIRDFREAETMYNASLKAMLGVRLSSCNDLVCIEAGEPGAKGYVLQQQYNFLQKIKSRDSFHGSYHEWVLHEAMQCRTPAAAAMQHVIAYRSDPTSAELEKKKLNVQISTSTRRVMYRTLNPDLSVSLVYDGGVAERDRKSFTRMRLSSHRMRCETGRWSRIPAEERLCPCGNVQNEFHVLLQCSLTQHLRDNMNIKAISLNELFNFKFNDKMTVSKYCNEVLLIHQ